MRVYIAGKVTGEPLAQCTMKFGQAQKLIESKGYEAVNPLALIYDYKAGLNREVEWNEAMKICLINLLACDAVYVLKDWEKSPGAMLEVSLAEKLKIQIIHEK